MPPFSKLSAQHYACFFTGMALFTLGCASVFNIASAELFSGITAIHIQMDTHNKIQIDFTADLPFQYEYTPIDANHFSLKLINARISDTLKKEDHTLKFSLKGSPIQKITLQKNADAQNEALIFEGSRLGEKLLGVTGAQAVSTALLSKSKKTVSSTKESSPLALISTKPPLSKKIQTPKKTIKMEAIKDTSSPILSTEEAFLALLATDETPAFVPRLSQENPEPIQPKMPDNRTPQVSSTPQKDLTVSFGKTTITREEPNTTKNAPSPSTLNRPHQFYQGHTSPKVIDVPRFGRSSAKNDPQFKVITPQGQRPSRFFQPFQPIQQENNTRPPSFSAPPPQVATQPVVQRIKPTTKKPQKPLPHYYGGAPPISYTVVGSSVHGPETVYTLPPGSTEEEILNALSYDPETAPESAEAHMYQALSHFRRRHYQRALALVEQAVEMAPENPNIMAALGEVQLKLENHKEAIKAYETAIKQAEKPKLKQKYLKRYTVALYLQGKRPQAIKKIARLLQNESQLLQEEYLPYFILGTLYQEVDNTPKAIPMLKKAATLNPDSSEIQFNLGLAFEFSGKFSQAKTHYQKALSLDPKAEDIAMALRRVRRVRGS